MEMLHLLSVILGITSSAFSQNNFDLVVGPALSEVAVGDRVELTCSVSMTWRELSQVGKPGWVRLEPGQQGTASYEVMSVEGNLESKYASGRWSATGDEIDNSGVVTASANLVINSVQNGDDGKYVCKLTSNGIVVDTTPVPEQVEILIQQPLSTLELTIGDKVFTPSSPTLELNMPPMGPPKISCMAGGSNPESTVAITIDGTDTTHSFTVKPVTNYVNNGADKFEKYRTVDVTYSVASFSLINSAKNIECIGTGGGQSMNINVQFLHKVPHTVTCNNRSALIGDHRVILTCTITSDPVVTEFEWRIGTTGEAIAMGNKTVLYGASKGASADPNTVVAELEIYEVAAEDFSETFILEYDTAEGPETYEVRLTDKYTGGAVRYMSGAALSMAFISLIHFMC